MGSMQSLKHLNTPRIGSPFCIAMLLFISKTAPAPSLTWLELPKSQESNDEIGWINWKKIREKDHICLMI